MDRNIPKITQAEIDEIIENPSPLYSAILAADLVQFIAYTHFAVNGSNFIFKPFHLKVITKLEDVVFGRNEKRNLGLCLPVGSGKTLLVQYFIAWTFCRSINNAYVYASHSETNIMKLSREVKDMFAHKFLQSLFHLKLKADEGSKTNWSFEGAINRTGLLATTMGTGSTGADSGNPNVEGYSGAVVIDDPIDAGKVRRPLALNDVTVFYDEKLATRRRTSRTPTIVVMQRLIDEDLIGWLKKNESEDWDFVEVPALDENGASFWPERYSVEEMEKIRRKNPFKFYAQYQQKPIKEDGTQVFILKNLRSYKELPQMERVITSWDTATKTKETNDYSVCSVWGVRRNSVAVEEYYLIFLWRDRVRFSALKAKFKEIARLYNPLNHLIEDKSAGETLIPELEDEGFRNLKAIQTGTADKVERAAIPSEIVDQGRVFLPEEAPWLDVFLNELATFPDPNGHDDQVDTMTQFLNWTNKPRRGKMGFNT